MDAEDWVARCAARLHQRWPRLADEQLREVAQEIHHEAQRQLDQPELAAAAWLRQGLPDAT
jgi:hypothetical protein